MKRLFVILCLIFASVVASFGCGAASGEDEVFVATVDGEINGRSADYVERVISEAEASDAAAVAIELDTPGGALVATERIIEAIEGARETPVIVYVPSGGAAISAGTFIMMASDVAAMAPGTRLGAATPVTAFGQDIPGDLGNKVTNDSVALITGLAERHGRNAGWAESAVREAASENAENALDMEIVEYLEGDLESVLQTADGVELEPKEVSLDAAEASLSQQNRTFSERFGIPLWVVVVPAAIIVLVVAGVIFAAISTSRWRISTGREGMIGEVGTVRRAIYGSRPGSVFVHGELWTAFAEKTESRESETLEAGAEVEIVAFRRSYIIVRGHAG